MRRPVCTVENLVPTDQDSRHDVILQVATPVMLHTTRQNKQYVTFDCGSAKATDIFDPSFELIQVFIWLGSRSFEEFNGVDKGKIFYARNALLTRKYNYPDEKQLKVFDNTLMVFYDELPAWFSQ